MDIQFRYSTEYVKELMPMWWAHLSTEEGKNLVVMSQQPIEERIKYMRENKIAEHLMDDAIKVILNDLNSGTNPYFLTGRSWEA